VIIASEQNLRLWHPGAWLGLPGTTVISAAPCCWVILQGEIGALLRRVLHKCGHKQRVLVQGVTALQSRSSSFHPEFVSHTTRSEGAGRASLPSKGRTDWCTGKEKLLWWQKISDGEKISLRNVLLRFPFPLRSQCCKLDISFSNCLHMLLLKNFSPHLLRAGWCRGIWKHSLCLPLASLPCMQLQSDTRSCRHLAMIPWGQKRVKAPFLKGMRIFPLQCFTRPCWLWRRTLQNGFKSS